MPRRILLLGASGQVGTQIALASAGADVELIAAARSSTSTGNAFALEDPQSISGLIDRAEPDHVILTAAATNVAWCEANPRDAELLNVAAPTAVAEAARRARATLTFVSTDYVFDGAAGPYSEEAHPNPTNVYGATKLAAERAVLSADNSNLVVRSCQVFGADPRRVNFVLRLVDQLREGKVVPVRSDLYGTPTFAPHLAANTLHLTVGHASGIWHVAGEMFLSRFDFAHRIARTFGLPQEQIVEASEARDAMDGVDRPRRAGLISNPALPPDASVTIDQALETLARLEVAL